jgi:hypothetical protein
MRLSILRASVLALVFAASPVSLSGGSWMPTEKPIVLAASDVVACNFPSRFPDDATAAFSRVGNFSGDGVWRTDIYDLADCLRRKAEAI